MRILLDLNVILDVIENRKPGVEFSAAVISVARREKIISFIPSHCITTIHYRATKHFSKTKADEAIDWLLDSFDVLPEDNPIFRAARKQPMSDFEDAVVATIAELNQCNYVITRNIADFRNSPVEALTPEEFLQVLDEMN